MTSVFITNLLKSYSDNKDIITKILNVVKNPKDYNAHSILRKAIEATKNLTPEFYAYYDEFHEFMYITINHGKKWCKPGTDEYHCTKTFKNETTGLIETYPARIDDDGDKFWCRDNLQYRTDVDQYGNLLPTTDGNTWQIWKSNGSKHRAELGKNPNDPDTFNKAMPAIICKNGTKEWYFDGQEKTQEELTEKLLAEVAIPSEDVLIRMIKHFNDKKITDLIADVMSAPNNYNHHCELRKYLISKSHYQDALFLEYYDQYHEYMYVRFGSSKRWLKSGSSCDHCDKKVVDPETGLIITLPAVIDTDTNTKYWYINNILTRTDVDKYGNLLPTQECPDIKYWNANNKQHRAELGNNPDDLTTYNKALPAIIHSDGKKLWKFEGRSIAQEELTAQLLGLPIPKPVKKITNVQKLKITYKNGDVREDTHEIESIEITEKD